MINTPAGAALRYTLGHLQISFACWEREWDLLNLNIDFTCNIKMLNKMQMVVFRMHGLDQVVQCCQLI